MLAKQRSPAEAKTRLCPPCTPSVAAALAEAALADTLAAAVASGADRVVLALDGVPGTGAHPASPWWARARGRSPGGSPPPGGMRVRAPALLVGMDTPQVTAGDLDAATTTLVSPGITRSLGRRRDGGGGPAGGCAPARNLGGVPRELRAAPSAPPGPAPGRARPGPPPPREQTDVERPGRTRTGRGGPGARHRLRQPVRLSPDGWPRDDDLAHPSTTSGERIDLPRRPLAVARCDPPRRLLARLPDPVLDVGCGPGRLAVAPGRCRPLLRRHRYQPGGPSPKPAGRGRRAAPPVFGTLPGEPLGRSALLDGNVGIGGDPITLPSRAASAAATGPPSWPKDPGRPS